MAHISINQYLHELEKALDDGNGDVIAGHISCRDAHIASPRLQMERPDASVRKVLSSPWDDVIIAHLRCVYAMNNHDFIDAYKNQFLLVQIFTKIFQSQKEENWALPIMFTCCLDLRYLAASADLQVSKKPKTKPEDYLEKAAELLMGCFRVCAGDTRSNQEDSKRWGMLFLANQLFKIYFKVNKVHLVKPLIRAIESISLKDDFPLSQRVTYKYYVGQKAMFESDFKSAEEHLSFAFIHCHKQCKKNKRLLLIHLIPVKMLLGKMPTPELLSKHNLNQFSEIAAGVVQGNLLRLNKALKDNENFFIRTGIYPILERLKVIVYRNLFKKVFLMYNSHRIPVDAFLDALRMVETEDMEREELLCILANLIYEGKIKGYISYQHMTVVLSKQNPFPALPLAS